MPDAMNTVAPDSSTPQSIIPLRHIRNFLAWWRRHMRHLDREATQTQVLAEGGLSYSYAFLVVTACGIATLGLMLNSVAVIIGAMLVAPLMGPIVLLGFAIAETNVEKAIRSGKALLVGVAGALTISVLIVTLSPYIPPTPEILARTSPNLFDLLVAVLSGMVAGYAVTNRKIGAVAGVAIATALMPPLAASGYGLAMGEMYIFQGAFMLFLTNMLAIALSVAGMAIWYGFGNLHTPRTLIWQTALAGLVLVVLSIPLWHTLQESVTKTRTVRDVEAVLREGLQLKGASLDKLDVRIEESGTVQVSAVVFTGEFEKRARERLVPELERRLGRPVDLALDQVLLGSDKLSAGGGHSVIANPVGAAAQFGAPITDAQLLQRHSRELLPIPLTVVEVNAAGKLAAFQVAPGFVGPLGMLRQMEETLGRRFPDWRIAIIPPVGPLPEVPFTAGSASLNKEAKQLVQDGVWALTRWQVASVEVNGSAALYEKGRQTSSLALQRAKAVAAELNAAGLQADVVKVYPMAGQRARESEYGTAAFRSASILPRQARSFVK
jgi:uncharacterized hydrophobic protein (TIGR00271 family)